MKIVFAEPIGLKQPQKEQFCQCMKNLGHDVDMFETVEPDAKKLSHRIAGAEILVVANQKISEDVLKSASKLKFISVAFTGVDHLPVAYCRQKGIAISNAAGYSTNAVAELAVASVVDLYRKITPFDAIVREGGTRAGFLGRELNGKIFGVLGLGAIGTRVANLAMAFGCKVIAYNRSKKLHEGVELVDLKTLFSQSDVVSIHIPANSETKGMVGENLLLLMKPNAILVNTARGAIIDYVALANALKNGAIAGAAVDVYEMEPPLPATHPMLTAPNTLLLPHIGFATEEAIDIRSKIVVDNIYAWLKCAPINVVL